MMGELRSSETSVLTTATRRNIKEDVIPRVSVYDLYRIPIKSMFENYIIFNKISARNSYPYSNILRIVKHVDFYEKYNPVY
jgi:hypothetical protein